MPWMDGGVIRSTSWKTAERWIIYFHSLLDLPCPWFLCQVPGCDLGWMVFSLRGPVCLHLDNPVLPFFVCVLNHSVLSDSCDPMDCSLPSTSVHGILQVGILEWVAMPSFRGSSWSMDWTWVSCIAGRFFTVWATRKPLQWEKLQANLLCWGRGK